MAVTVAATNGNEPPPPGAGATRDGQLRPACLPLAHLSFLGTLQPRDLARLERLVRRIPWDAGEAMPRALAVDDHLFVVREGRIALLATAAGGHRHMVALVERGGLYSTLGGAPLPEAMALEDAVVSPIPGQAFSALAVRYPQVGVDLAGALSDRLAMLREVVAGVGQMHVEDRLWSRVLALAGRVGVATPTGLQLRLPLTHSQWALLVGASRESVTLAFGKFRRTGQLRTSGRMIEIPWDHVKESSTGDPGDATLG